MKKILFYAGAIAFAAVLAACDKKDDSGSATDGKIGGVTWATANVDDFQTFAARPDMYTKLYQWNRSKAWPAEGNVSGWTEGRITDPAWTVNPCPAGWRLPTQEEFLALRDAGHSWVDAADRDNAVPGRFFGANHATATLSNLAGCVFMPAGTVRNEGGVLNTPLVPTGGYWSSTQQESEENITSYGCSLFFTTSHTNVSGNISKAYGLYIRCVQ